MTADRVGALLAMLERGQDSALLRFSVGNEYVTAGRFEEAAGHLRQAIRMDPGYSAAWKLLGRALTNLGRDEEACAAYREGIAAAEVKGDRQAAREMGVFLKRLLKQRTDGGP
jgi:predicted Zn-dependent protease